VDLLGEALARRPELHQTESEIERSRKRLSLSREQYWPDVSLGVNYIGIDDRPDDPAIPPSDEGDDAWAVALAVNIPVPDAGRRARVRHAEKQVDEALLKRESTEDRIRSEIESALARLRSLHGQLRAYEDSLLPLAREMFAASESEYQAGTGTFLDLLDSERTLLRTLLSYVRTVRDYQWTFADLERALGSPIEGSQEESGNAEAKRRP
jgi:cobalt-zinc-cadmium efflux system outer membrane protein